MSRVRSWLRVREAEGLVFADRLPGMSAVGDLMQTCDLAAGDHRAKFLRGEWPRHLAAKSDVSLDRTCAMHLKFVPARLQTNMIVAKDMIADSSWM